MSRLALSDLSVDAIADAKLRRVALKFRGVMEELDLDLADPHLEGTELRVARAYREQFAGLAADAEPAVRTFPNTERYSEMISLVGISFSSVCAHHFLPFFGSVHVAYKPSELIVGLSKLARVVEFYARRPQVQERMTEQIVEFLDRELRPAGAMVVVQARHCCMETRGVNRVGIVTTTSAVRGVFKDDRQRQEFWALLPRLADTLSVDNESNV